METHDVLLTIEREERRRAAAVRALLVDEGREDLALEFDQSRRDIALGLSDARSRWHSISPAQRRVLEAMEAGGPLARGDCRMATARALCAHELIHPNGGAFDPEASFVLTERARFVLRHGRPQ